MKKRIIAVATAALSMLTMTAPMFSHAEGNDADFVIFGDSISVGEIRGGMVEHNYGEILANYYGGTVSNYAISGLKSNELLEKVTDLNAEQSNAVKNAEYVVISIGGNDIAKYFAIELINFCAQKKLLKEGYTKDDIPNNPTLTDVFDFIDQDALQTYASASVTNAFTINNKLRDISANLTISNDGKYDGYNKNFIIANINKTVSEIKNINPNAEIIVQNLFQPLQIDPDYLTYHTSGNSNYKTIIGQLRSNFEDIMKGFNTDLAEASEANGFKVADIYTDFTSLDSSVIQNSDNPGNAGYFINIMAERLSEGDVHPNQKGHLAIAAEIIDVIGKKHNDGGLLSDIFENLSDKASYPSIALASYESAAGTATLGDVNFDGVIDAIDASAILSEYAETSVSSDNAKFYARQTKCAMVSDDDVLDAKDASIVLTYYAYTSTHEIISLEEYLKTNQ